MFANAFGAEHLNIRHVETAVHVSTLSLSSFSLCFIFFPSSLSTVCFMQLKSKIRQIYTLILCYYVMKCASFFTPFFLFFLASVPMLCAVEIKAMIN